MTLEGRSIIGFARSSGGGALFRSVNATTGDTLEPEFVSATKEDVDRSCSLAEDAFATFGRASGALRGRLLRTIAARLENACEALVARAQLETALPEARLRSELGRTCGQLRMFASLVEDGSWVGARIDRADPARKPLPKPDIRSMLRPLGPVAVFGASNFPLAFSVAGGDTASALAAGCPVVVKAHAAHPGTSELAGIALRDAVRECGISEGAFSLLFDEGYEIGLELVRHPSIRAVGFTGSRRGGLALTDAAAHRAVPIPVYAEMGSINPVFVLQSAMRERGDALAAGLHASVTLGVGQFCTNPGLVVVVNDDAGRRFLAELEPRIRSTPASPMLTQAICDAYHAGVAKLGAAAGVARLVTAEILEAVAGAALFATDAATFMANESLMNEVFGPSTLVVQCATRDEMLAVARSLEGQLTATIHAGDGDQDLAAELAAMLERRAGRVVFNGFPTGVEVCQAMIHGGPYPATSDGRSTSVGTRAIERFARAVCYQDCPDALLPAELQEANPLRVRRIVDGVIPSERSESRDLSG